MVFSGACVTSEILGKYMRHYDETKQVQHQDRPAENNVIFTRTYRGIHTQTHMYDQHTRGMATNRYKISST